MIKAKICQNKISLYQQQNSVVHLSTDHWQDWRFFRRLRSLEAMPDSLKLGLEMYVRGSFPMLEKLGSTVVPVYLSMCQIVYNTIEKT